MSSNFIDYGRLIDSAMHVIVRQALGYVKNGSLPGKHHFFISFLTSHKGVKISNALREKYPEEMTIVLQHQFENLKVTEEYFSVVLSFDHVKETIQIPFASLIAFADPSVKFGLQFSHAEDASDGAASKSEEGKGDSPIDAAKIDESVKKSKKTKESATKQTDNVIDIDAFRKK